MIKFGINSNDLKSAASTIGAALKVEFCLHESSFRGGDYYRAETPSGTMFLQNNRDVLDNEPFEANWPMDQLVLYFDGADDDVWEPNAEVLRVTREPQVTQLSS